MMRNYGRYVASLACLAAAAFVQAETANAQSTYYIDFNNGNDAASGTSPATAWRRSPGDPEAQARAAGTRLMPGDRVLFRGGVVYRGSILLRAEGAPGRPIIFSGSDWGGRAIISGSDAFQASPQACESTTACGVAGDLAKDVFRFPMPAGVRFAASVNINGRIFQQAAWPVPALNTSNGAWILAGFRTSSTAVQQDASTPTQWMFDDPELARAFPNTILVGASIAIHGSPNLIHHGRVVAHDVRRSRITFESRNFRPERSSQTHYALYGHAALIQSQDQVAIDGATGSVFLKSGTPPGPIQVTLPSRSIAFRIIDAANIEFRGFEIRDFGSTNETETTAAFLHTSRRAQNITIANNLIHNMRGHSDRNGTIALARAENLVITGNTLRDISPARGVNMTSVMGGLVENNNFERVDGTNIIVMRSENVRVAGNTIIGPLGTHQNGISVYLTNRNTVVENNDVINVNHPFTFHGPTPDAGPSNLIIRRNFLVAAGDGGVALRSWGSGLSGVTIAENIALGTSGASGALLNATDNGVVIRRNIGSIVGATNPDQSQWNIADNFRVGHFRGSIQNPGADRLNFRRGVTERLDLRKELEVALSSTGQLGRETCTALFPNRETARVGSRRTC